MLKHIMDSITEIGRNLIRLIKWMLLSMLVGVSVGGISTLFAHAMIWVTDIRGSHTWLILLLPVGGIMIVGIYQLFRYRNDRGTNMIL